MINRNGLEVARAEFAFKQVGEIEKLGIIDSYNSLSKKLSMYILTNGLGFALAFVKSKRNEQDKPINEHRLLYQNISYWLKEKNCPLTSYGEYDDLVAFLISLDAASYRAFHHEVLALLSWIQKFSEGLKDTTSQPNSTLK